jgi:hypothetical protein
MPRVCAGIRWFGDGIVSAEAYCADCGNTVEGHDPGECTLRTIDQHLNPDCRDGKHRNCAGDKKSAWCVIEDAPTECECDCHEQALASVPSKEK